MRFAHAYATGGGTESYLEDLDRELLETSAVQILRIFLARENEPKEIIEQKIGKGTLLLVPLTTVPKKPATGPEGSSPAERTRDLVRRLVLRHPLVWKIWAKRWNRRRKLPLLPGQAIGAGRIARELFSRYAPDLLVLHYAGGADAEEVLHAARDARIPSLYLNHYANDRLEHLAIRKHLELVDAIAGVNGLDVPADLAEEFTNLSDGIDLSLFRPREAGQKPSCDDGRLRLLLPGRITREKGQMDLLRSLECIVVSGLDCEVALAGRTDDSIFLAELRAYAAKQGIADRVHVLGNLTPDQLQMQYQKSALMVLPTYHHEGLPRVLLESQAMETPVVAYAAGGIPEGIVQGRTGYFVPKGDLAGLTSRIRELLRAPERRREMGLAGRRLIESRFSRQHLADRHASCYQRVIAAGCKASRSHP